jgi:hypothetical protein
LIAILSSCQIGFTPQKELNCVEKVDPWIVPEWNGNPLDTNSDVKAGMYYHRINEVDGINSANNEYCLSHFEYNSYLTYGGSSYSDQFINKALIVESDLIRQLSDVQFQEKPFGFLTGKEKKIFFASIPNHLNQEKLEEYKSKKINKYKYLRIPTDEMIGRSRLFSGNISDNKIENPKEITFNNSLSDFDWESHPALSPDGKTLFFASTRDGGLGGIDIWFVKINEDGTFGQPQNPGSIINTPKDEITPFINRNGTKIYFSSNGRETVGGFDIHSIDVSKDFWNNNDINELLKSKNIGFPINTLNNEISPNTDKDLDERFYYASDQKGGDGNFDIWVYHKVKKLELITKNRESKEFVETEFDPEVEIKHKEDEIAINEIKLDTLKNKDLNNSNFDKKDSDVSTKKDSKDSEIESDDFVINGKVTSEDNKPIVNANVTIKELPEDKIQSTTKTDEKGEYKLTAKKGKDLKVIASGDNYFFDEYIIPESVQDTLNRFVRNLKLDLELTLRINFPYDIYDKPYQYVLDKNGNETKQTWQSELEEIATNIIESKSNLKKVILVGHTDLVGSNAYNNELGLNRVIFVSQELIKRGVPENLLEIRSAGKKEPLQRVRSESEEQYYKRLRRVTLTKIFKE